MSMFISVLRELFVASLKLFELLEKKLNFLLERYLITSNA